MALSDHGQYSGVVDIARNGIDEVIRLQPQAKQDDALIRNFVAAIKLDRHDWEDWPEDSRKAFEALRARLEGKP